MGNIKAFPLDSYVQSIGSDGLPVYSNGYNSKKLRSFISSLISDGVIASSGENPLLVTYGDKPFPTAPYIKVHYNPGNIVIGGLLCEAESMSFYTPSPDDMWDLPDFNQTWSGQQKMYFGIRLHEADAYKPYEDVDIGIEKGRMVSINATEVPDPEIADKRTFKALASALMKWHFNSEEGTYDITIDSIDTRPDDDLCGYAAPFADVDLSSVMEKVNDSIEILETETDKAVRLANQALSDVPLGEVNERLDALEESSEEIVPIERGGTGADSRRAALQSLKAFPLDYPYGYLEGQLDNIKEIGAYMGMNSGHGEPDGLNERYMLIVGTVSTVPNQVYQLIITLSGKLYNRTFDIYANSWSAWSKFLMSNDTITKNMLSDELQGEINKANRISLYNVDAFNISADANNVYFVFRRPNGVTTNLIFGPNGISSANNDNGVVKQFTASGTKS